MSSTPKINNDTVLYSDEDFTDKTVLRKKFVLPLLDNIIEESGKKDVQIRGVFLFFYGIRVILDPYKSKFNLDIVNENYKSKPMNANQKIYQTYSSYFEENRPLPDKINIYVVGDCHQINVEWNVYIIKLMPDPRVVWYDPSFGNFDVGKKKVILNEIGRMYPSYRAAEYKTREYPQYYYDDYDMFSMIWSMMFISAYVNNVLEAYNTIEFNRFGMSLSKLWLKCMKIKFDIKIDSKFLEYVRTGFGLNDIKAIPPVTGESKYPSIYSIIMYTKGRMEEENIPIYFPMAFPPPIVNYLSGPYYFLHMKDETTKKNIYLFGETHSVQICEDGGIYGSIPFYWYLYQMIQTTSRLIDIYIELPRKSEYPKVIGDSETLRTLHNVFYDCINHKDKSGCKMKNARFHWIDLRREDINFNRRKYNDTDYSEYLTTPMYKMLSRLQNEGSAALMDYYKVNSTLVKEMRKSTLTEREYLQMINRAYDLEKNRCKKLTPAIRTLEEKQSRISVKNVVSKCLPITSILVDLYTIARIFKQFHDAPEPVNIVYYGGANHVKRLRVMLEELNFTRVDEVMSNRDNRCLDMRSVRQPLF